MADGEAEDALHDALTSVAEALGNGRRAELVDGLPERAAAGLPVETAHA